MTHYTIHHLPESERPRERLIQHGADKMSNAELIALILGSGTRGITVLELAQNLLCQFQTMQELSEATIEELCQVKGMGKAKAVQLKAALALVTRMKQESLEAHQKITSPKEAYLYIREDIEHEKREVVVALFLNTKGRVIKKEIVAIGSLNCSVLHPREVFYMAIRYKAMSVVVAHNHPSGDPTPSQEDIDMTKKLVKVGDLMGIPLRDHIIVGKGKFYSFLEGRKKKICDLRQDQKIHQTPL